MPRMRFATRWFGLRRDLGEQYSPLYFLASLVKGGRAVAFFIWLNFLVPHPKNPIVFFGVRHLRLLLWNIREYAAFRKTSAYARLRQSNAEVTLMGLPLALTM